MGLLLLPSLGHAFAPWGGIDEAARDERSLGDKNLSATQVETEVFAGKVYLLGMVRSQKDADRSMAHAKAVKGVTSVTSLLLAPKKVARGKAQDNSPWR